MKLQHGGDLAAAARRFGISKSDWLDLSTGINPRPWPVPELPAEIWSRLPHMTEELMEVARAYYGCDSLLAVPGSQFAIQALPELYPEGTTVAIPVIGYQEHPAAWQDRGHAVHLYTGENLETIIDDADINVIVLINPNNPGCQLVSRERIENWLARLQQRGAALIIDEAFMDTTPQHSLAALVTQYDLIILRSVGKFFGLAGVRLGFVLAGLEQCASLQDKLGPWAVSGPAQWVGLHALADRNWQVENREWLFLQSRRLKEYLQEKFNAGNVTINNTPLFVTLNLPTEMARDYYQQLGAKGILVRLIEHDQQRASLRFGLLRDEQQWRRLQQAMERITVAAERSTGGTE